MMKVLTFGLQLHADWGERVEKMLSLLLVRSCGECMCASDSGWKKVGSVRVFKSSEVVWRWRRTSLLLNSSKGNRENVDGMSASRLEVFWNLLTALVWNSM